MLEFSTTSEKVTLMDTTKSSINEEIEVRLNWLIVFKTLKKNLF